MGRKTDKERGRMGEGETRRIAIDDLLVSLSPSLLV